MQKTTLLDWIYGIVSLIGIVSVLFCLINALAALQRIGASQDELRELVAAAWVIATAAVTIATFTTMIFAHVYWHVGKSQRNE